jgi:hypothetical protein
MKKILLYATVIFLFASCSIFRRKEKLGCPNDARNMSQEEIVAKSNKKKYRPVKN